MDDSNQKVHPLMPDGTRGTLTTKPGFKFKRGRDAFMGLATNKNGVWYEVRSTHCGLPNCYCDAKAKLM